MKNSLRKPVDLIGDILNAGVRIILLVAAIEFVLVVIVIGVGAFAWFNHGFLSGVVAGIVTFLFGQSFAVLILDMTLQLPERSKGAGRDSSDEEVLESLRVELGSTAEQGVAPNRSVPPTLNSTSSVRGSEDF